MTERVMLRVVPEIAPFTATEYVPAGVPFEEALLFPPPQEHSSKAPVSRNARRNGRRGRRRFQKFKSANASRPNPASRIFRPGAVRLKNGTIKEEVRAVLVIVAVNAVGWPPETLTCVGEIVHVEAGIGSVHDIASAPENPLIGEACKLKVAVSPALIVTDVDPLEPSAN